MRNFYILRGCSGSGKGHLVQQLGLEELTIGYDQFRALYGISVECSDGRTLRIEQRFERQVVEAAHQALISRFMAGATVVFDSTALKQSYQLRLVEMAAQYGYRTKLVDVQGQQTLEQVQEHNLRRDAGRLAPEIIESQWRAGVENSNADLPVIADQGRGIAHEFARHLAEDSRVPVIEAPKAVIVGDVHSCSEPLRELITEHDGPDVQWTFAGDLFDRGPDPVGVWNAVNALGERATVVTGNHERNLRHVVQGTRSYQATKETYRSLNAAGIDIQQIIDFVDRTVPAAIVCGKLVTHGGVGPAAARLLRSENAYRVAESECIYGVGGRSLTHRGRGDYDAAAVPVAGNQVHGHRNGPAGAVPVEVLRPGVQGGVVTCLEAGAGGGGAVRAAICTAGSIWRTIGHADGVADEPAAGDLLAQMEASELVRVQPVEGFDGIVSCNFTREAFQSGGWDHLTTQARGLFIDTQSRKVVARGYEKFFHIGEAPGWTLDDWRHRAQYPVTARKKANGFLALVASVHGNLMVATKSGITPYSEFARSMLLEHLGYDGAEQLRQMLERTDTTALFEAISARDPHPVDDAADTGCGDHLVLLDCVRNAERFETHDNVRAGISNRFKFTVAPRTDIAYTPQQFDQLLATARQRTDEGVVLIDSAGHRGKVKADGYAARKRLRGRIERVWRGKADTLGRGHETAEQILRESGVWGRLTDFEVTGFDGAPKFDLARACEAAGL